MSNSSKPVKLTHLQKLANQSALNGAYVIEITKTCTLSLIKARKYLIFWCWEKRFNWKKTEDGEDMFFKESSCQ